MFSIVKNSMILLILVCVINCQAQNSDGNTYRYVKIVIKFSSILEEIKHEELLDLAGGNSKKYNIDSLAVLIFDNSRTSTNLTDNDILLFYIKDKEDNTTSYALLAKNIKDSPKLNSLNTYLENNYNKKLNIFRLIKKDQVQYENLVFYDDIDSLAKINFSASFRELTKNGSVFLEIRDFYAHKLTPDTLPEVTINYAEVDKVLLLTEKTYKSSKVYSHNDELINKNFLSPKTEAALFRTNIQNLEGDNNAWTAQRLDGKYIYALNREQVNLIENYVRKTFNITRYDTLYYKEKPNGPPERREVYIHKDSQVNDIETGHVFKMIEPPPPAETELTKIFAGIPLGFFVLFFLL